MTRSPDLFGAVPAKSASPPRPEPHRCRVCLLLDVGLSDDLGRTWFCVEHAPAGFFPKDRA